MVRALLQAARDHHVSTAGSWSRPTTAGCATGTSGWGLSTSRSKRGLTESGSSCCRCRSRTVLLAREWECHRPPKTTYRVLLCKRSELYWPRSRGGARRHAPHAGARRTDMQVVGEAADGQQAVDMVAELRPDVVVLDVRMPSSAASRPPSRSRSSHSGHRAC